MYICYLGETMLNKILDMYNKKLPQTGFMKHYLTLFSIVEGLETKKSFEFGTGVSTEVILEALKRTGGEHISCDIRPFEKTGANNKILSYSNYKYIQNTSININFDTIGPFDFVLHDGSHEYNEVHNDIKKIVPRMKKNGILLIHDTEDNGYSNTLKDAYFDAIIEITDNIENITLPFGYGLTICRILKDFNNGIVNPEWKKIK